MLVKEIITPEGVCCRVDDDAYRSAAPEEIGVCIVATLSPDTTVPAAA